MHTPGPWRWQGEDYRGDWGWQTLVGPDGEGLIVGDVDHLRVGQPVDPGLCITGLMAEGKPRAKSVCVFGQDNARLIAAAPELLEALKEALTPMGDWKLIEAWERKARAAIAKAEGRE